MSEDVSKEKVDNKVDAPEVQAEEPKVDTPAEEPREKKEEAKPSPKKDKKPKMELSKFSDIFVTESDTFDITVKYYKKGEGLIVSEVDDEFDEKVTCAEFQVTFKYPDQGDSTAITAHAASISGGSLTSNSVESLDIREFLGLEFGRVLTLIRGWTIDQDLSNQNILKLHPKIVKSIIAQVRSKIGTDGII